MSAVNFISWTVLYLLVSAGLTVLGKLFLWGCGNSVDSASWKGMFGFMLIVTGGSFLLIMMS